MPQYFFDVRSSQWDYYDPDGIALSDDEAAIAYAERMIRELKADEGYDAPDLQMYVENESRRRIVTIPFNPTEVRTSISTPSDGASRNSASIERTTPLTCGSQASVTIRMRLETGASNRMASPAEAAKSAGAPAS